MSEFNEVDNIIEEETPVLHLELEDGTEQDCAVIALFSVEELDDQERFDLMMMKDVADRYTGTLTQEKDTFIDRITVQLSRNYPNPV